MTIKISFRGEAYGEFDSWWQALATFLPVLKTADVRSIVPLEITRFRSGRYNCTDELRGTSKFIQQGRKDAKAERVFNWITPRLHRHGLLFSVIEE